MKRTAVIALAALLAGCAGQQPQIPVQVSVAGPQFAPDRFACDPKHPHPVPPDPDKTPPARQGSAAAAYDEQLDSWGRGCRDELRSIGAELDAAGQIKGEK